MKRKIKIESLVLDHKNPRLPNPMDSEASIIEHMISEQQTMALLEDIAENWLSPIEDLAVFKDKSGYVVLEGNRRVSALKLLDNPELLPPYSKKIKEILKKHNTKLVDVECEVFDKREDAKIWLERKHSGQQNGIGTKSWSAEQKTRFESGRSNNNTLAVSIIDFAKKNHIKEAETEGILTTVTRFLANPTFRNSIGLRSNTKDSAIVIDVSPELFTVVLENFISDVADKNNKAVSSRSNKDDYIKYGNYLYDTYLNATERVDSYTLNEVEQNVDFGNYEQNTDEYSDDSELFQDNSNSDDIKVNEPELLKQKEEQNTSSRQRSSRNPNNRKYVFTTDFYCKSSDKMIMAIYHELRTIEVETLSLSCAMMTRIFLESILKKYLEQVSANKKNRSKLDDVINEVNTHLSSKENLSTLSSTQEVSLKSLKLLTEKRGLALSPFSLGVNAHGGAYPKATDLKTDWMNIEPIIQYVLNETK